MLAGCSREGELVVDQGVGWAGLGDLTAVAAAAGCDRIPVNLTCSFTADHTIQLTDPVVLVNEVTVQVSPEGYPNVLTATARHELDVVEVLGEVVERPEEAPEVSPAPPPITAPVRLPENGAPALLLVLAGTSLVGQGSALIGIARHLRRRRR